MPKKQAIVDERLLEAEIVQEVPRLETLTAQHRKALAEIDLRPRYV